jgi:UDP-N-acetylmuramate--alanine ligase
VPRVHFVGIGGYSMSGLAQVWRFRGFEVTGSDLRPSSRTRRLEAQGIPVFYEHRPENVIGADLVVYTTDVPPDNPELVEAKARGIPIRHRSELLAEVINRGRGVAVTGTHGKTTTSTLTATAFLAAGADPTVLLGGEVDAFHGSARPGGGEWVVAEADESDASFLNYLPEIAVITNIEPEHLEHYDYDFENVRRAYAQFVAQVKPGGAAIVCADDPEASRLAPRSGVRRIAYGLTGGDVTAADVRPEGSGHRFRLVVGGRPTVEVVLPIPGLHNVQNALGALAAAWAAGLPLERAAAAFRDFRNAHRRFEEHYRGGGILVVDDYAHHPTEIRAVLRAARGLRPRRLIALFQPQRYTRTEALFEEFVRAFDEADLVLVTEIYSPPGERPIPGVSGEALARRIAERRGGRTEYVRDLETARTRLSQILSDGDLLLTMGAGDVFTVAEHLAEELEARQVG